jgi:hypothetical protein
MGIKEALNEHENFAACFELCGGQKPAAGTRAAKLKELVAQVLVQAISVDHKQGMNMLEKYQKEWAGIMENADHPEFNSLSEYLTIRTTKFGMR